MKYVPSIAFEEMSGTAKGVTAAKTRGRKYIRNKGTGSGIRTASQAGVKSIFKQISQSWKTLTNDQILSWNKMALSQSGKRVLGSSSKISGSNLFSRLNFWIIRCGGKLTSTPPSLVGVEAPATGSIECTDGTFALTLPSVPASVANLKLIIMASAPQSNGVSSAYSKAVQMGGPKAVSTSSIDFYGDYCDTFGLIEVSNPKVFVKYFFVNTVTGEKSGEVLIPVVYQPA